MPDVIKKKQDPKGLNDDDLTIIKPGDVGKVVDTGKLSKLGVTSTLITPDSLELSELPPTTRELIQMSMQVKDPQSVVSLIIVFQVVSFIDKCIMRIKELLGQYRDVEKFLVGRLYIRQFLEKGLVRPKTYIYGTDRADIKNFHDEYYKMISVIEKYAEHVLKLLNERKLNPQTNPGEIEMLQKELNTTGGITELGFKLLSVMLPFTDQFKIRLQLPESVSTEKAKDFRELLCNTQIIARQAEVLFMTFFQDLLAIHPELRQDYQDIEVQTNMIYNNLYVSTGVIYMEGQQVSVALRTIIKALGNLIGDFESLKMQLLSSIKPSSKVKDMRAFLKKLVEGSAEINLDDGGNSEG